MTNTEILEDGFGGCWKKCERPDCGLQVVRPGKVQCHCDTEGLSYIPHGILPKMSGYLPHEYAVEKLIEEIRRLHDQHTNTTERD